jgi:hypothetical protein
MKVVTNYNLGFFAQTLKKVYFKSSSILIDLSAFTATLFFLRIFITNWTTPPISLSNRPGTPRF